MARCVEALLHPLVTVIATHGENNGSHAIVTAEARSLLPVLEMFKGRVDEASKHGRPFASACLLRGFLFLESHPTH